jgi:transcription-repair coupling factor (superfamily II helicase)
MKLAGLLSAALADPGLARAQLLGRSAGVEQVDITAPQAIRPFLIGLLAAGAVPGASGASGGSGASAASGGGTGRMVLAVTATTREADDLAEALGCLIDPNTVAI